MGVINVGLLTPVELPGFRSASDRRVVVVGTRPKADSMGIKDNHSADE